MFRRACSTAKRSVPFHLERLKAQRPRLLSATAVPRATRKEQSKPEQKSASETGYHAGDAEHEQTSTITQPTSGSQVPLKHGLPRLPREDNYMLTLETTTLMHRTLTSLRKKYYDPDANEQSAQIELFRSLPATELYRIVCDVKELTDATGCFPLHASTRAARYGPYLTVGFRQGREDIVEIFQTLRAKWEDLFVRRRPKINYRPTVIIQYKEVPKHEDDLVLQELNAQLHAIAALGGGGPMATKPVEEGGGSLRGVATGLALFRQRPRRGWLFARRFSFYDVPTRGWDAPELLSLPVMEGTDRPDGFISPEA